MGKVENRANQPVEFPVVELAPVVAEGEVELASPALRKLIVGALEPEREVEAAAEVVG